MLGCGNSSSRDENSAGSAASESVGATGARAGTSGSGGSGAVASGGAASAGESVGGTGLVGSGGGASAGLTPTGGTTSTTSVTAVGTLVVSWEFPGWSCPVAYTVTVFVSGTGFTYDKMFDCSTTSVSIPGSGAVSIQAYLGTGAGYAGPFAADIVAAETTDAVVSFPAEPYPITGTGTISAPHP